MTVTTPNDDRPTAQPYGDPRLDGISPPDSVPNPATDPDTRSDTSSDANAGPTALLLALVRGRSVPCPRCGHDLCNIPTPVCPECGEPLVLKVGSPRVRFGWLVVAMVPGCFSGVAALFVFIPVAITIAHRFPPGQGTPWPVMAADGFGFLSAGSVVLMYRHRHRLMAWSARRQGAFAAAVWGAHVLAFVLYLVAMW